MNIIPRAVRQLVHGFLRLERTVGIQSNRFHIPEILPPDELQNIQLLLEIDPANFHLDTGEAIIKFYADLLKHHIQPPHPDQAVYWNRFPLDKLILEDGSRSTILQVKQRSLTCKQNGR